MLSRSCARRCVANTNSANTVAARKEFTNAPMKTHSRSQYKYHVSDKGEDVGARNEAAFIGYSRIAPSGIAQKLAIPHALNLLSIVPIVMTAGGIASAAWGAVMWGLYSRKHYSIARIERPANLV